jgi:hypothetical protein
MLASDCFEQNIYITLKAHYFSALRIQNVQHGTQHSKWCPAAARCADTGRSDDQKMHLGRVHLAVTIITHSVSQLTLTQIK